MPLHLRFHARWCLLVSMILWLVACTSTPPAMTTVQSTRTFRIGVSQTTTAAIDPWRQVMHDQIQAAAARYPQLSLIFTDAQLDTSQQIADVEALLQQSIDLLIISPNEALPLTQVVTNVYNRGIPVIVLDRKIVGSAYTLWIGADNKAIGNRAGAYTAAWCQQQQRVPCRILEVRGLEGSTPTIERGDGFREGIARNADAQLVASQNADWLTSQAITATDRMLALHPQIDVIYAHNDPMADGARIAASRRQYDLDATLLIGIDGLPTADGGLVAVRDQRLDLTYVYPTGGTEAIEWAVRILNGDPVPVQDLILDTDEVTLANAATVLKRFR